MAAILIIDDDPDFRDSLSETLVDLGHAPVPAATAQAGLAALEELTATGVTVNVRRPTNKPNGSPPTHSIREGAASAVTRIVTLLTAPSPSRTRALILPPRMKCPSIPMISGFHAAYPGASVKTFQTLSAEALMVDVATYSFMRF